MKEIYDHLPESSFVVHPEVEHSLTRKELHIIILTLCGYTVSEIADKLNVGTDAIYKHHHEMVEKTPCITFQGVLGLVIAQGIVTCEKPAAKR